MSSDGMVGRLILMDCEHCGRMVEYRYRSGPMPKFCGQSCRQRAYELRLADQQAALIAELHAALGAVHNLAGQLLDALGPQQGSARFPQGRPILDRIADRYGPLTTSQWPGEPLTEQQHRILRDLS